MQRVRLLRRRREPVSEHDRDEVVDPLSGGLRAKVEDLVGGKGLAQDHHGVNMGVCHGLGIEMGIQLIIILTVNCNLFIFHNG